MNTFGIATVATSALAAAFIGLAAPAAAAPTGPANAEDTISQLREGGYRVVVNNLGPAPLDEASVVAIRPSYALSQLGTLRDYKRPHTSETVYLDVK